MTPRTIVHQAPLCPWDSPGKNTEVSCHALLQGDLLNPDIEEPRESNLCLLHLLHWQAGSLPLVPIRKPLISYTQYKKKKKELQKQLLQAPALALPDLAKPFDL